MRLIDSGTNGAIEYDLLRDGGVFDIDPTTGFLSLASSLDTETTPRYTGQASGTAEVICSVVAMTWWLRPATVEQWHAAPTQPSLWMLLTSMTTDL
jgi:hypothetical protein